MARQNQTKTIGAFTYEVTPLGAIEGRRVFARVARLLGGTVASLAGAGGGKMDPVRAFTAFCEGMSDDTVDYFCDVFAKWTQVHMGNGKVLFLKDIFDDHFAVEYGNMVEWLTFCLQVNFSSFLGGTGGLAALLRPAQASSESESPKV